MTDQELKLALLEKNYLLFAPRNGRDLRSQYRELADYPEFHQSAIKTHDLLFVWWMKCTMSPFVDIPDESEKRELCILAAYATESQRSHKANEFKSGYPNYMQAAMKRMETFNMAARVETLLYTRTVRENCAKMLAADVDRMDPAEQESYAKRTPGLWKLLQDTTATIEQGAFGVVERELTIVEEVSTGSLRAFRQSRGGT